MITQIRIVVEEGTKDNTYSTRYNRLSILGQKTIKLMAIIYNRSGQTEFNMNDFRGRRLGNWKRIRDAFYELESRQFGKVGHAHIGTEFSAFVPVLQSIG